MCPFPSLTCQGKQDTKFSRDIVSRKVPPFQPTNQPTNAIQSMLLRRVMPLCPKRAKNDEITKMGIVVKNVYAKK
jgi:hypothetical protein